MLGGSFQLPITAERVVIKQLSTVQTTKQSSGELGSWEGSPNFDDGSEKLISRLS